MTTKKFTLQDFATPKEATTGKDLPLTLADGTMTEEFLTVVGMDSAIYRRADVAMRRKLVESVDIKDEGKRQDFTDKCVTEMLARLIIGWSLETPLTYELAVQLLTESPHTQSRLDNFVSDRKRFFGKPPENLLGL